MLDGNGADVSIRIHVKQRVFIQVPGFEHGTRIEFDVQRIGFFEVRDMHELNLALATNARINRKVGSGLVQNGNNVDRIAFNDKKDHVRKLPQQRATNTWKYLGVKAGVVLNSSARCTCVINKPGSKAGQLLVVPRPRRLDVGDRLCFVKQRGQRSCSLPSIRSLTSSQVTVALGRSFRAAKRSSRMRLCHSGTGIFSGDWAMKSHSAWT